MTLGQQNDIRASKSYRPFPRWRFIYGAHRFYGNRRGPLRAGGASLRYRQFVPNRTGAAFIGIGSEAAWEQLHNEVAARQGKQGPSYAQALHGHTSNTLRVIWQSLSHQEPHVQILTRGGHTFG